MIQLTEASASNLNVMNSDCDYSTRTSLVFEIQLASLKVRVVSTKGEDGTDTPKMERRGLVVFEPLIQRQSREISSR